MHSLTKTILLLNFIFHTYFCFANNDDIFEYPSDHVELGQGWDSKKGEKKNVFCVITSGVNENFKYQTVKSEAKKFKSKNEYSKLVQLNVNAKAKSILGSGSLSVSSSELKTMKMEENVDKYIAVVDVKNVEKSLKASVILKPEYKDLYDSNYFNFIQTCGDTYVASIKTGGSLFVDLKYQNSNFEERRKVEFSLGGATVNVKVDGKKLNDETKKKYTESLEISYYQDGANGLPIPANIEEVSRAVSNFPAAVSGDNDRPYKLTVSKYDVALPSDYSENQKRLRKLTDIYFEIEDLFNFYDQALTFPEVYIAFTYNTNYIRSYRDKLNELRYLYLNAINECYSESKCETLENNSNSAEFDLYLKYYLRARLPIRFDETSILERRENITKDLSNLTEQISKTDCYIYPLGQGGISIPNNGQTSPPPRPPCNNPAYLTLSYKINQEHIKLNQLNSSFLIDVVNASYNRWVKYDLLDECKEIDLKTMKCPSSTQIDSIKDVSRQQIVALHNDFFCQRLEDTYSSLANQIQSVNELLLDNDDNVVKDEANLKLLKDDLMTRQYNLIYLASNIYMSAEPGCHLKIDVNGELVQRDGAIGGTVITGTD